MNKKENCLLSIPLIIDILIIIFMNIRIGNKNSIVINNFEMISNNYINFVSILIGFLITTISIIIGFFDKKIVKIIVESKKDKVLYINWSLTIITGILSILLLFYIAAVFDNNTNNIYKIPASIFVFFMLLFIGYLFFSLMYFLGIAKSVMRENIQEEDIKINKEDVILPKDF